MERAEVVYLSPSLPESSVLEVVFVCVHPCASERVLTCVMETGRFKRVAEMLEPQLNMLVAQNSIKKLSLDDDGK
jgi:hypothetical protein